MPPPVGWVLLATVLFVWSLANYLPLRGAIWSTLTDIKKMTPSIDFDSTANGGRVWTWSNWLWFPSRLPEMFSPAMLAVLAPLAVAGFWRGARGRRAWVVLYACVPVVIYSFIMGTRKIEYIGPTIALVVFFAVHAVAGLRRAGVRLGIVALLLALATGQAWWQIFGLTPYPILADRAAPNRVTSPMFAGVRGVMLDSPVPDGSDVLPLALIRRLGRLVEPGGEVDLINAVRTDRESIGRGESVAYPAYRKHLVGRFTPLFSALPRDARLQCFDAAKWKDRPAQMIVIKWDRRDETANYDASPALRSIRSRFAIITRIRIDSGGPYPYADVLIPR